MEVLNKVKNEGLLATYDAVSSKLDQPLPLGYCGNVGSVLDSSDTDFLPGTRVISNGNHAGVVRVPNNLVAVIPNSVSDDERVTFTVLGSIALQGIRLANPSPLEKLSL